MSKLLTIVIGLALAMLAAPCAALADTAYYASAGITRFSTGDTDVTGLTGRLGWQFHKTFAVEAEASAPLAGDSSKGGKIKLDHAFGIYGVAKMPVTGKLDLFARIGLVDVKATASMAGKSRSSEAAGIGFGAGLQWKINDKFALRGEYTRMEGGSHSVDAIGIAGVIRF